MERDHLFISYAWEDGALAEWLWLHLTSAGYRVWCDRFKLLGGEPWPTDIDEAIRNRTFRVLHLVSAHSISKPNPSKERELALALGRDRGIPDFLIPLNVDGTRPSDLPWRIIDITFIPFQKWSDGLSQLLKKLQAADAPRPLSKEGPALAARAFLPPAATVDTTENLSSNCFQVLEIPSVIRRYGFSRPLHPHDEVSLRERWAFRQTEERRALSFAPMPADLELGISAREIGASLWKHNSRVDGIYSEDLAAELVKKATQVHAINRGFRWSPSGDFLYLPASILEGDRIAFTGYSGKRTYIRAGGKRKFGVTTFRYRLGLSLWVRRDIIPGFALLLRPRLLITGEGGKPLAKDAAFARRKRVAKSWFNHQWYLRVLALAEFLFGASNGVVDCGADAKIAFALTPLGGSVNPAINEQSLLRSGNREAVPPQDSDEARDAEEADPT